MDVNVQAARPRTRILCPTRGALGRAPSEVWAGGRDRDGARTERESEERCERCFAEEYRCRAFIKGAERDQSVVPVRCTHIHIFHGCMT